MRWGCANVLDPHEGLFVVVFKFLCERDVGGKADSEGAFPHGTLNPGYGSESGGPACGHLNWCICGVCSAT